MDTRLRARSALVALLQQSGVSWTKTAADILDRGSETAAIELLEEHLRDTQGLLADRLVDPLIEQASERIAAWESSGIDVRACFDPEYPPQLRDIQELPPILFTRGEIEDDQRSIAIVGTRQPSPDGQKRAAAVSWILAEHGIPIVSGLAAGIDTIAHTTALEQRSRTIAVIGTGIERHYPAQNQQLQEEIATRGLLISQFWPDAGPSRRSFPMRNAVMSGYAAATVVVEASQRSGTRIQARHALNHGRSVVLLRDVLEVPWARDLVDRPGVVVVHDADQFLAVVKEILSARFDPTLPGDDAE
ncbi:hypothetical protein GCM10029992_09760 [Glycomyces albus]